MERKAGSSRGEVKSGKPVSSRRSGPWAAAPFVEHDWVLSPKEALEVQKNLAALVRIEPLPSNPGIIGAADIAYSRRANLLIAVVLSFQWPGLDLLESAHHMCGATFPYVPGLLSFREVPPILEAFRKLSQKPEILLCDGQGIAHPRKMGFASHLGLCLGLPTVGCAKSRLCGEHDEPPLKKGSSKPLMLAGEQVGLVFCSRDGVKPIYISPGHLSDIPSAEKLVFLCLRRYRIPEPLRLAHIEATRLRERRDAKRGALNCPAE